MHPESCRQIVKTAKCLGFKRLGFSGGEPFLYRELLLELAEIACENSIKFVISTNGYWGKDSKEAESLVRRLQDNGLIKLQLSYDMEHSKYVKDQAIYNILRACKSVDLPVVLSTTYYPGEKRINELLNFSDFENIELCEGEVLNVGKARRNVLRMARNIADISPIGRCIKTLQFTVNFDGEIYPCCSVGGFTKGLSIGNIATEKLDNLTNAVLKKTFVYYLQNHDANWIVQEIAQTKRVVCKSVCELCNIVHANKNLLKKYSAVAEEAMFEVFFQNAQCTASKYSNENNTERSTQGVSVLEKRKVG